MTDIIIPSFLLPFFSLFPLAVLGSLASTAAVVAHAFHTKKQFYPAVVMITNSNVSMLVRITIYIYIRWLFLHLSAT